MYEQVKPIAGVLLNMEEDLKREFETRIAETSTLAFRVAFAVLRNSGDAEDVAQEAFAKAYRWFSSESVIRRPGAWARRSGQRACPPGTAGVFMELPLDFGDGCSCRGNRCGRCCLSAATCDEAGDGNNGVAADSSGCDR
jgi:sigma-70-like protein